MKRTLDLVLSLVGVVLLSPLLALAALCIKADSEGPVFYRGIRAGRFGKPFRIFKLRTMVANAEKRGGAETPADDARITRVGSVLRYCKLDEVPQLLNVVKGEMSIVGPRPEVLEEVRGYDERERELLKVLPGITDWASIKFRHEDEILRGSADPHAEYHRVIRPEKVRLGLQYVHHHTIAIDCKVILATLAALFSSPGGQRSQSLGCGARKLPTE